jgi:hypothetical protein
MTGPRGHQTLGGDMETAFKPLASAALRLVVLVAIAMLLILVLLPAALGLADLPIVVGA